jgi:hypothetical protein
MLAKWIPAFAGMTATLGDRVIGRAESKTEIVCLSPDLPIARRSIWVMR